MTDTLHNDHSKYHVYLNFNEDPCTRADRTYVNIEWTEDKRFCVSFNKFEVKDIEFKVTMTMTSNVFIRDTTENSILE